MVLTLGPRVLLSGKLREQLNPIILDMDLGLQSFCYVFSSWSVRCIILVHIYNPPLSASLTLALWA